MSIVQAWLGHRSTFVQIQTRGRILGRSLDKKVFIEFSSLIFTVTSTMGFYSLLPLSKSGLQLVCNGNIVYKILNIKPRNLNEIVNFRSLRCIVKNADLCVLDSSVMVLRPLFVSAELPRQPQRCCNRLRCRCRLLCWWPLRLCHSPIPVGRWGAIYTSSNDFLPAVTGLEEGGGGRHPVVGRRLPSAEIRSRKCVSAKPKIL